MRTPRGRVPVVFVTDDGSPEAAALRQSIAEFIAPAKLAKARRIKSLGQHGKIKRAAKAAQKLLDEANAAPDPAVVWDGADAGTVLGLYAVMHEKVYGVFPGSVTDGEFGVAQRAAGLMRKQRFGDSWYEVVKFVRWVWQREVRREAERAAKGQTDAQMIRPKLMFSQYLLEDYKVAQVRQQKGTRR